jgi:hypothetical protein
MRVAATLSPTTLAKEVMSDYTQMLDSKQSPEALDSRPAVKPKKTTSKVAVVGRVNFVGGHPRIDIDNFGTAQGVVAGDGGEFFSDSKLHFTIVSATQTTCSGEVDDQNLDRVNKALEKSHKVKIHTSGKSQ